MKTLFLTIAALLLAPILALHAAEVENLRCMYLNDPLGVDVAKPRLSWVIQNDKRGQKQTACQILVASAPEILAKDLGDLWDSGKVASDQSIQVEYAGKPLESRTRCHYVPTKVAAGVTESGKPAAKSLVKRWPHSER